MTALHAHHIAPLPWCELEDRAEPEFRIQWASDPWMDRQAFALRRQVFCEEQALFAGDDRDDIDRDEPTTRNLVALSCLAGQGAYRVGTGR